MDQTIQNILHLFGFTLIELRESSSGYRNRSYPVRIQTGEWINVVFYKREQGILERVKAANKTSNFLAYNGFPSRVVHSVNGQDIVRLRSKSGLEQLVCVYNFLEGETIPWEGYTSDHIKLLGGMMGKMHLQLTSCHSDGMPDAMEELRHLQSRMRHYFSSPEVNIAMERKLGIRLTLNWDRCGTLLTDLEREQRQVLHLDFVRGNILFSELPELHISGVIDFEKAAVGPRILDIARTLAFLIVDCKYKQEEKIRKYFLYNGYQKRGNIPLPDLKLLEELLNFFWIHDFYKFLKHNPFEYLPQNEHFLRTQDILLRRNLLHKTNG